MSTTRQTHGYQKQGVAYGYCKVKGLNALSDALRVRRVREDPQRGNAHHCQIFGLSLKDANNLFSNPLPWASL